MITHPTNEHAFIATLGTEVVAWNNDLSALIRTVRCIQDDEAEIALWKDGTRPRLVAVMLRDGIVVKRAHLS